MRNTILYIIIGISICACKASYPDSPDGTLYRVMAYNRHEVTGYGFADRFDNIIILEKYKDAKQFSEGLAAVSNGEKWGYIDEKDSVRIPFQFDNAGSFGEYGFKGLAIVKDTEYWFLNPHMTRGQMGFINRKGQLVTAMKYCTYGYHREFGLFWVTNQCGKFGWLNEKAEEIIPCIHDSIIGINKGIFSLTQNGSIIKYNNKGVVVK